MFLLLSCMRSVYILDTSDLSDVWIANIFSHSVPCLFVFITVSFNEQKF